MFTLYHGPGSCSLASLIALEASGLDYEVQIINTRTGANLESEYLAINPASKVPALRFSSGEILTENPAILMFVADLVPDRELIPPVGTFARAQGCEWLNYLSSGVHIAYRSVFRPGRLSTDESAADAIRTRGRQMVHEALQIAEDRLSRRKTRFAVSDTLSVCDAYLLVYWLWRYRDDMGGERPALPAYASLIDRIVKEAPVRAILEQEGLKHLPEELRKSLSAGHA